MGKILLFLLLIVSSRSTAQIAEEDALALQFFQAGEYEKALPLYQKLYEKSNGLNYYDQYFSILLKLKKYDVAERLLNHLLKTYPDNSMYQVDYGRILQERGLPEKARAWYNQLIENIPKEEFAIRELATTFYRAEAYDYSVKTLIAGRKLLKDENAFAFELISLYRYQKNKDQLVQELLKELNKKPEMQTQAKNIISSVFDSIEDYDILKRLLLTQMQRAPENLAYNDLLVWVYLQQKQYNLALKQAISLDKRLEENGQRVYELAYTFILNNAHTEAVEALNYLVNKGKESTYYIPARIQLLNSKYQLLVSNIASQSELAQLEKEYEALLSEFGKTRQTVLAIRQLATLKAFYLNKAKEAALLIEDLQKVSGLQPSVIGQAKLELGDIYILSGEVWEAALTYGQVEKQYADLPLGQEAKFRNAKLAYYQGDFSWAKAQLDVLKSATSQLVANDALNLSLLIAQNTSSPADSNALSVYADAELLLFKKQFNTALSTLETINTKFPGNSLADDILMAKARIYLQQNKYKEAEVQLESILSNYSFDLWADDALFMLAELNELHLKDPLKAQQLYQKMITDYPGSLYVNEARKRYRSLRGDKVE